MTEVEALQEEIAFLVDQIGGILYRMAKQDNAAQKHKLALLNRILEREGRWLAALVKREQAA